jgi:hypothetical protein
MMITRRGIAFGGALTIIWHSCPGNAQFRTSRGCVLSDAEAGAFFATAEAPRLVGDYRLIPKSGNSDFDYALAQTLSRMADTLDILPTFTYYDDYDSPNAKASPRKFAPSSDGSVLFGKRLFLRIMSQPEHPDVGVTAVCAHEFGHVLQFKHGLKNVILQGQRTVKRFELHADFLAGYYAGQRKLQKSDYPAAVFATQQESVGDFGVDQPDHHGRPYERAAAIVRGFEVAYRERRGLSEAIQVGINYVSTL